MLLTCRRVWRYNINNNVCLTQGGSCRSDFSFFAARRNAHLVAQPGQWVLEHRSTHGIGAYKYKMNPHICFQVWRRWLNAAAATHSHIVMVWSSAAPVRTARITRGCCSQRPHWPGAWIDSEDCWIDIELQRKELQCIAESIFLPSPNWLYFSDGDSHLSEYAIVVKMVCPPPWLCNGLSVLYKTSWDCTSLIPLCLRLKKKTLRWMMTWTRGKILSPSPSPSPTRPEFRVGSGIKCQSLRSGRVGPGFSLADFFFFFNICL